jgi:hypothetical protein
MKEKIKCVWCAKTMTPKWSGNKYCNNQCQRDSENYKKVVDFFTGKFNPVNTTYKSWSNPVRRYFIQERIAFKGACLECGNDSLYGWKVKQSSYQVSCLHETPKEKKYYKQFQN